MKWSYGLLVKVPEVVVVDGSVPPLSEVVEVGIVGWLIIVIGGLVVVVVIVVPGLLLVA